MSLEADHHHLRVDVPTHREPLRQWVAAGLLYVAVLALGASAVTPALGLAFVVAVLYLARDRRQAHLLLSHDTLTVQITRLGRPHRIVDRWDAVRHEVLPDGATLVLELAGHRVPFAWDGPSEELEALCEALQLARERYRPGADAIPDAPRSLESLRAPAREG